MSSSTKKKSSSKPKTSHTQNITFKEASRKRKAKKWSKGKAKQTQTELDAEVDTLYSLNVAQPTQELALSSQGSQDSVASMQALEQTLRDL